LNSWQRLQFEIAAAGARDDPNDKANEFSDPARGTCGLQPEREGRVQYG
jgi:hypothetical protein